MRRLCSNRSQTQGGRQCWKNRRVYSGGRAREQRKEPRVPPGSGGHRLSRAGEGCGFRASGMEDRWPCRSRLPARYPSRVSRGVNAWPGGHRLGSPQQSDGLCDRGYYGGSAPRKGERPEAPQCQEVRETRTCHGGSPRGQPGAGGVGRRRRGTAMSLAAKGSGHARPETGRARAGSLAWGGPEPGGCWSQQDGSREPGWHLQGQQRVFSIREAHLHVGVNRMGREGEMGGLGEGETRWSRAWSGRRGCLAGCL